VHHFLPRKNISRWSDVTILLDTRIFHHRTVSFSLPEITLKQIHKLRNAQTKTEKVQG